MQGSGPPALAAATGGVPPAPQCAADTPLCTHLRCNTGLQLRKQAAAMAKGLRSKSKRRFRTLKRQEVVKAPAQLEAEAATQEQLAAVLAAPRPNAGDGGEGAGPAAMDGLQQEGGDAAMAVDGDAG